MPGKNDLEKQAKQFRQLPAKYDVKAGDSWFKISERVFGSQMYAGELARANADIQGLRPGMVLKIPRPRPGAAPVITSGEAMRWGMSPTGRPAPAPAPAPAPRVRASPGNLPPAVLAGPAGPAGYKPVNAPDPYQVPQPPAQQQSYGPNGETLPAGALGWDYYGRPFYGGGVPGWMAKTANYLNVPAYRMPKRAVGVVAGTAADLMSLPARWTKQAFSTGDYLKTFPGVGPAPWMPSQLPQTMAGIFSNPQLRGQLSLGAWNRPFTSTPGLPFVQERSPLDASWQAGSVYYTSILEEIRSLLSQVIEQRGK